MIVMAKKKAQKLGQWYGDVIVKTTTRLRVSLSLPKDTPGENPGNICTKLREGDYDDITDEEILEYHEVMDMDGYFDESDEG